VEKKKKEARLRFHRGPYKGEMQESKKTGPENQNEQWHPVGDKKREKKEGGGSKGGHAISNMKKQGERGKEG